MDVLSVVRRQGMFPEHSEAGFGAQMKNRILMVGVCLLVVITGTAWMLSTRWHSGASPVWNTYRTGRGAAQEITLSGRSTIILNTDSELHVLASGTQRKVQLVRGEALFNIAHDPQHPFEVSGIWERRFRSDCGMIRRPMYWCGRARSSSTRCQERPARTWTPRRGGGWLSSPAEMLSSCAQGL